MKKLILIIISALTALTLCACGQEETPAEPTPVPTLEFASGSYPVDAESLRIVVTADEMPRMDEFTALKAVDFTGSDAMRLSANTSRATAAYASACAANSRTGRASPCAAPRRS